MTVAENVAYAGPHRVDELLELLGISALRDARPGELSGGERQRVAVARALARDPAVLLLDEPLAALDAHTRARVRAELGDLLGRLGLPTLLVTHDFQDAAALAERVGVLVDGSIVQEGTAPELVASPTSPFVADFTGGNLLRGDGATGRLRGSRRSMLDDGSRIFSTDRLEGHVGAVVYPWEVAVAREAPTDSAQNHVAGPIVSLVPDRQPRARPRRPADGRDHRGLGRPPRAPPGRARRGELQGDRDAARAAGLVAQSSPRNIRAK